MKQSQSLPIDLIAYLFTGNIIDLFPQVSIFFKQVLKFIILEIMKTIVTFKIHVPCKQEE